MLNNISTDKEFSSLLFNKLPIACIILNADREILALNQLAEKVFNIKSEEAFLKRPGEILNCVHANYGKYKCGFNDRCMTCPANFTISNSLENRQISHNKGTLTIKEGRNIKYIKALFSASLMEINKEEYIILTVQDTININEMQGFLPVCASCKKVSDENGWKCLEKYIGDNSEVELTHTICPECLKKLYPKYAERVLQEIG